MKTYYLAGYTYGGLMVAGKGPGSDPSYAAAVTSQAEAERICWSVGGEAFVYKLVKVRRARKVRAAAHVRPGHNWSTT
jgi:hypothetical protein